MNKHWGKYSGNSSYQDATYGDATVVLPLGRYFGVNGNYLSIDADTTTSQLYTYSWSNRRWESAGTSAPYVATGTSVYVDGSADNSGIHANGTVAWTLELAAGESKTVTFKAMVKASDFTYDRQSEKALAALKEVAEFEGYTTNAAAEFAALEKKLSHDIDRDFDIFKEDICQLLADELVTRYYHQRGSIIQRIKSDSTIVRARQLLADEEAYRKLLVPLKKK